MRRWFSKRGKPAPKPDGSRVPARGRPGSGERPSDWRTYDGVAEIYERAHAPYTSEPVADAVRMAEIVAGERVLDVGTGTGRAVELVQEIVGDAGVAAGVDPSVPMLAVGHTLRPGSRLVAGDVLDLPFADQSFDAVLSLFSLAYFAKLETALFDIGRVLREGGRLAAITWTGPEDEFAKTWRRLSEETVGLHMLRTGVAEEIPWGDRLSDAKRFEAALRDNGFRPVRIERHTYRFTIPREDFILGLETEASGRFVRAMLGPALWESFRSRVRDAFADYPDPLVDIRDALVAVAGKPQGWQGGISGT